MTYIEAHGTGTALGDPLEIKALTQAFRTRTSQVGYCALGSVKTNIGHLDTAAGIAGLIKTVLALHHKMLPPSLHFEQPNPQIDFAHSPFYVNTRLSDWKPEGSPRRAGVSSLGIGGTNAHVVLEEAPLAAAAGTPTVALAGTLSSHCLGSRTRHDPAGGILAAASCCAWPMWRIRSRSAEAFSPAPCGRVSDPCGGRDAPWSTRSPGAS